MAESSISPLRPDGAFANSSNVHLTSHTSRSAGTIDQIPPYTTDEKVYLTRNWRDEYHFLLQHGLNIHKEEDRAEGRSILRVFKNGDSSNNKSEDTKSSLQGHQADYNFTSRQLGYIEKYYGNSENFMFSYGLKFYNDDDLEEAKAIVNAMMAQDTEKVS